MASMPTQKRIRQIEDLQPDSQNCNKGTERGSQLLERSLREYGAGRSIVADKNGVVLCGNKTLEAAAGIGLKKIVVVETDGTTLVVVQRTDLDAATPQAKELAISDNRTGEVNLDWDAGVVAAMSDEVDLSKFFGEIELKKLLGEHLEAGDFECCENCGRKMPKNRSRVAKPAPQPA